MNKAGFTIIELMIATAVFAVILIVTAATLIGITGTYTKGEVQGQTQQTARSILSDLSQSIEFNDVSGGINITSVPNTDEYYFCIGDDVYVYNLDKVLSTTHNRGEYSKWGLVRYNSSSCPASAPANPAVDGSEELLATNERLGELQITQPSNGFPGYTITIEVGYGIDDALISDTGTYANGISPNIPTDNYVFNYQCLSGTDSSFCAVSTLTTTVASRIN